ASLLEVLRTPFVRSARARGLGTARVLWHHALPPALLPVVSYLGPAAAYIITGSLVVESVFALPGSGRFLVQGAIDRDYPLVMGMVVVYAALTLLLNLVADLACGWLDPGSRDEGADGARRRLLARGAPASGGQSARARSARRAGDRGAARAVRAAREPL